MRPLAWLAGAPAPAAVRDSGTADADAIAADGIRGGPGGVMQ